MKTRTFLGIDVGTSSVKLLLTDREFRIRAESTQKYCITRKDSESAEIDSVSLWQAILLGIKELSNTCELTNVSGIGISTLCPGLCALDKQGNLLREPILYCDLRSVNEAERFEGIIGKQRFQTLTGNRVMAGTVSVSSILWMKGHEKDIVSKTMYFGHLNTWICAALCGTFAMDPTNAAYTGLFDTARGIWDTDLCRAAGIEPAMMPEVIPSYKSCGLLRHPDFIRLGIPADAVVVIGSADTASAACALGALQEGSLFDSVGTTEVLTSVSEKADFTPAFMNRPAATGGGFLRHGAMTNTGQALSWGLHELGYGNNTEEGTIELTYDLAVKDSVPGAKGVVFLPYLAGERSPVWDASAKGVFWGITAQTTRADLLRAVLESENYALLQLMDMLSLKQDAPPREILVIGGGSCGDGRMQLKADITGCRILAAHPIDYAALGACMLASIGTGDYGSAEDIHKIWKPTIRKAFSPTNDAASKAAYERNSNVFRRLYPALQPLFKK